MSVYVVNHKNISLDLPAGYINFGVGENSSLPMNDSTGDNIAHKNDNYCELTALYWIWKNSLKEMVGLNHYRRIFMYEELYNDEIVQYSDLKKLLHTNDIILPPIHHENQTVYQHYINSHNQSDIDLLFDILKKVYPEYMSDFLYVMNQNNEYGFNIFMSQKQLIDEYCEWIFTLLFNLEEINNIEQYDEYQKRVYGFLSERLFNVWVFHHRLSIKELPVKSPDWSNEKILEKKQKKLNYPKYKLF